LERPKKAAILINPRETYPIDCKLKEALETQDVASSSQWPLDTNMLVYSMATSAGLVTLLASTVRPKTVIATCHAPWTTPETAVLSGEITSTEFQARMRRKERIQLPKLKMEKVLSSLPQLLKESNLNQNICQSNPKSLEDQALLHQLHRSSNNLPIQPLRLLSSNLLQNSKRWLLLLRQQMMEH
jgi:hypothetical protein